MKEYRDLLYRSLDGKLSSGEEKRLKAALDEHPSIRRERDELLKLRSALKELRLDKDPDFVERIMSKTAGKNAPNGLPTRIARLFPRVAAACVIALIVTFLLIFWSDGPLSTDVIIGVENLQPEDAYLLIADN